jgi:hypothetical protein
MHEIRKPVIVNNCLYMYSSLCLVKPHIRLLYQPQVMMNTEDLEGLGGKNA